MESEVVLVRDTANGRVHKRHREEGSRRLSGTEDCNADPVGAYDVLTDIEFEAVEYGDLCRRCFDLAE